MPDTKTGTREITHCLTNKIDNPCLEVTHGLMEESGIKTKNILMTAIVLQWRHVPNSVGAQRRE